MTIYIYIYIYMYVHICVYIYGYIYTGIYDWTACNGNISSCMFVIFFFQVVQSGNSLIAENNKTKFFHKYRAVSQELEKCLDDLLLISDTISSLEDDEEGENTDSEEEDKPPDELQSTISHEGIGLLGFTYKDPGLSCKIPTGSFKVLK